VKNLNRNKIISVLIFLSILILNFCTPIIIFLNVENYYLNKFDNLNLIESFQFNLSEKTIKNEFRDMINFINHRDNDLNENFWSYEDIVHLQDVKNLTKILYLFSLFALITIISAIKYYPWCVIDQLKRVSLFNILIILIIGFLAIFSFNTIFTIFHKILFANDYWLLNPETSNLIKFFPQQIFAEIALYIGIFVIIISILQIYLWRKKIKKF